MTKHNPERRALILEIIAEGSAPSIRELTGAIGLASTSATAYHLQRLDAAGLIVWEPGMARSLRLTPKGRAVLNQEACPTCDGLGYVTRHAIAA